MRHGPNESDGCGAHGAIPNAFTRFNALKALTLNGFPLVTALNQLAK